MSARSPGPAPACQPPPALAAILAAAPPRLAAADPFAERSTYKDNLFDRAMIWYFSSVMSKQLGGEGRGRVHAEGERPVALRRSSSTRKPAVAPSPDSCGGNRDK